MRRTNVCVCVCVGMRVLLSHTSLCLGLIPQSCPQEKGYHSPCLQRAPQAWPLIMYGPSPYNWQGPSGHQAPATEKKKKKKITQTTFAFDLIILHGWFMALWASARGPFRQAVRLTPKLVHHFLFVPLKNPNSFRRSKTRDIFINRYSCFLNLS